MQIVGILLPSCPAPLTRTALTVMPHEIQPSEPCATIEKTVVPCSSSRVLTLSSAKLWTSPFVMSDPSAPYTLTPSSDSPFEHVMSCSVCGGGEPSTCSVTVS